MESLPLISIVIPARNAAATLAQTLDSVLAQTEGDWEAIVVDDGSTDETAAIIAAYAARDPRFSGLTGPGMGVGNARNLGIAAARGKYLHFLDADDWNDPSFYEKMLAALRGDPEAIIAYCGYRRVLPGGKVTEPYGMPQLGDDPFEEFARGCPVAIHSVLAPCALIVEMGGFDTAMGNCEDWDLWQRISRFPGKWILVDEGLAFYRTEGGSLSNKAEWLLANSRIMLERGFGGDVRLARVANARTAPPSDQLGPRERAFAYSALWTAGMACGAGGSGKVAEDMLRPFRSAGLEARWMARVVYEGLLVGTLSLPSELAERWPGFGGRLTELIDWLGKIWNDPKAARAIQYYLEEMILHSDSCRAPRQLSLTQSVHVDIHHPPETILAPGIDRLHVGLANGNGVQRYVSVAALGPLTKLQWAQLCGLGYRAWRNARPDADWQLARRIAATLLRQPGLLRRRSKFRTMLNTQKAAVIATLAKQDGPPGSHAARLAEIKAWASEYASTHAVTAPVEPVRLFVEDGVDPADRQGHFESLFETEDPWKYSSPYEQEKYQRQIALLPKEKIGRALELGCAEGHFTVQLAPQVGHLLATDISSKALKRTQARCAQHDNIDYRILDFSAAPIPGDMDLIVCSEILYYLADEAELRKIAPAIVAALKPGGCIVMAHAHAVQDNMARTGFDWDSVYGVDVIHRVFSEISGLALEHSLDTELYRIDRFRRIAADAAVTSVVPVIETAPVVERLEREVARSIIWGGATILRSQAIAREQRFQVPILMYHGVSDEGPAALARYRVSPALFKAQMRWLRANGFYAVGSQQLLEKIAGYAFPGRPVVISFDDGFQDFADNAWPILAAHDFTAEMFVVTDRVGQTAIWDEDKGEPARLMDAATIARLAAEGALFGSHMATHTPLDGLTAENLAKELAGSRAMLAQWLGQPPISFAAPFSIEDSRLGWMAMQCGYRIGYSGEGGAARLDMNPFQLPRIEVRGDRPLEEFIARMEATL
jgi:peptidoglycan/xylan/chitin deacetylase (PgdA/CDA1 family)/SAM-dependent methyltransferase